MKKRRIKKLTLKRKTLSLMPSELNKAAGGTLRWIFARTDNDTIESGISLCDPCNSNLSQCLCEED